MADRHVAPTALWRQTVWTHGIPYYTAEVRDSWLRAVGRNSYFCWVNEYVTPLQFTAMMFHDPLHATPSDFAIGTQHPDVPGRGWTADLRPDVEEYKALAADRSHTLDRSSDDYIYEMSSRVSA